MKVGRISKSFIAVLLCLVMILGSVMPVFAAAPAKEKVEYEGKGRVEVEFMSKVNWKNPVVTVKDSTGKNYTATIVKKDNDDITFAIKGYKEGEKYSFSISGVKRKGTSGYGTVNGTVAIPARTAQNIKRAEAKNTAIMAAVKNLGLKKSTVREMDVEKDRFKGKTVWEVSFEGKRANKKGWFEFEYLIDMTTGKILRVECERD